jgi:uncharacterized protein
MSDGPQLVNVLNKETSPYLLQHAANPVHWQPWSHDALAFAKKYDRPILLSVGYSACHWCHVMAHESFEDFSTAQLMNQHFINIKVDREERPDLDELYQRALSLMGVPGGWPLTLFLTPELEPFHGGTYFPRETMYGRPAFSHVLSKIAHIYAVENDVVQRNTSVLAECLPRTPSGVKLDIKVAFSIPRATEKLLPAMDFENGGNKGAPKFPQTTLLELFWRDDVSRGTHSSRDLVALSLRKMSNGGIYDHLGGGFARYSTDETWLVAHFEKMLYDNAQLLGLLSLLYSAEKQPLWLRRAEQIVDWLAREMLLEGGAFASALDADSEGREGAYYVWTWAELTAVLGPDLEIFAALYGAAPAGNWEGYNILHLGDRDAAPQSQHQALIRRAKAKLMAARAKRPAPGRDHKVLCDWNGMMIAALAEAAAVFERGKWLEMAETAFNYIKNKQQAAPHKLIHSSVNEQNGAHGFIDDYAQMGRAALMLAEKTGRDDYVEAAKNWIEVAFAAFEDQTDGGFFTTSFDQSDIIARQLTGDDKATPSPNATMAEVLVRLYHLSGEKRYMDAAGRIFHRFSAKAERAPFSYAGLYLAKDLADNPLLITLTGPLTDKKAATMFHIIHAHALPRKILRIVTTPQELPSSHPARKSGVIDKAPAPGTVYVCLGPQCSLPITAPGALEKALQAL